MMQGGVGGHPQQQPGGAVGARPGMGVGAGGVQQQHQMAGGVPSGTGGGGGGGMPGYGVVSNMGGGA